MRALGSIAFGRGILSPVAGKEGYQNIPCVMRFEHREVRWEAVGAVVHLMLTIEPPLHLKTTGSGVVIDPMLPLAVGGGIEPFALLVDAIENLPNVVAVGAGADMVPDDVAEETGLIVDGGAFRWECVPGEVGLWPREFFEPLGNEVVE